MEKKSLSEAQISKLTLLEAGRLGLRLFRNNRGFFKTQDGRPIRAGLEPNGSADYIGWTKEGFFAAVEIKSKTGSVRPEQKNYLEQVKKSGGFACVIRDHSQLKIELEKFYADRNMFL